MHFEVFLAAGYAVFLIGVALGLDLMAHHSHKRSERFRTAGFTYHPTHDAWICPQDQLLVRDYTDYERRLVVYRGRPLICNSCPVKAECTDSDEGREVRRAMDPWPHSEAGRFHRGISLVIALLAAAMLVVEMVRNHAPLELAVLGGLFTVVTLVCWHLHSAFRHTPANFPGSQTAPAQELQVDHKRGKEVHR
ncbi:MAG: hypothetical protein AB1425_00675 [Actinomycetota bacterium]